MKKILTISAILAFTIVPSIACYNVYYTADSNEHMHRVDRYDYEGKLNKNFNAKLIVSKMKTKQEEIKASGDYKVLNDYAVMMIKLGEVDEALDVLVSLHQAYPEEYTIVSNLGTTYELAGEVDSALKYINLGMELNPDSHDGSEWVHIKVLETKKELEKDSTYLERNTVLDLTEEQEKDSMTARHIWIQIQERFPFTPAGDPIMASLLQDMADCWVNTISVEYALAFYQIARGYHNDSTDVLQDKINETAGLMEELKHVQPNRHDHPNHEMHQRVGYTNYNTMMDDHFDPDYAIPWDDLELDADTLLSWVGLTTYEFPAIDSTNITNEVEGENEKSEKKSDSLIWILLAGGVLIMVGMFFYLRKRK